jgi:hypothetical protein
VKKHLKITEIEDEITGLGPMDSNRGKGHGSLWIAAPKKEELKKGEKHQIGLKNLHSSVLITSI